MFHLSFCSPTWDTLRRGCWITPGVHRVIANVAPGWWGAPSPLLQAIQGDDPSFRRDIVHWLQLLLWQLIFPTVNSLFLTATLQKWNERGRFELMTRRKQRHRDVRTRKLGRASFPRCPSQQSPFTLRSRRAARGLSQPDYASRQRRSVREVRPPPPRPRGSRWVWGTIAPPRSAPFRRCGDGSLKSWAGSRAQGKGSSGSSVTLPATRPLPMQPRWRRDSPVPRWGKEEVPPALSPAPRRCLSVGRSAVNAWPVAPLRRPGSRCGGRRRGRSRPAERRAQRGMGARAAGGGRPARSLFLHAGRGRRRAEVSAAAAAAAYRGACGHKKKKSEKSVKKARSLPTDSLPEFGGERQSSLRALPGHPRPPSPRVRECTTLGSRLSTGEPGVQIVIAVILVRERSVLLSTHPLNRSGAPSSARLTLPARVPAEPLSPF